jgi:hypothetical protein
VFWRGGRDQEILWVGRKGGAEMKVIVVKEDKREVYNDVSRIETTKDNIWLLSWIDTIKPEIIQIKRDEDIEISKIFITKKTEDWT